MNVFEISELGKLIRKKRKERGLRLEDLADGQISTATISNIERGVPHVNKEKVIYLLDQLQLDINEVPQMLLADSENRESMQLKFTAIETMLELKKNEQAYRFLNALPTKSLTYHQAVICSLKGRYHYNIQELKKAERELSEAVRLAGQDRYTKKTNFISRCYGYLAKCRFSQGDSKHALLYLERGIRTLQATEPDHAQTKHVLMICQVEYLEQSGRTDEALKCLDQLWQVLDSIQDTDLILHMYVLQAKLLRRVKLHQDLITCARKGIKLASTGSHDRHIIQLWLMLGMTYLELYQLEDAETCFTFVQELEVQQQDHQTMIRAYCSLGYLYLMRDELAEAERVVQQAIDLTSSSETSSMQDLARILYGQIQCKRGNYELAIEQLQQAIAIATKTNNIEASLRAHLELAECYRQTGLQANFMQTLTAVYQLQRQLNKNQQLLQW